MSDHGDAPDPRTDIADLCRVTSDGVGLHADLLEEFPYLGVPHAVQV